MPNWAIKLRMALGQAVGACPKSSFVGKFLIENLPSPRVTDQQGNTCCEMPWILWRALQWEAL